MHAYSSPPQQSTDYHRIVGGALHLHHPHTPPFYSCRASVDWRRASLAEWWAANNEWDMPTLPLYIVPYSSSSKLMFELINGSPARQNSGRSLLIVGEPTPTHESKTSKGG